MKVSHGRIEHPTVPGHMTRSFGAFPGRRHRCLFAGDDRDARVLHVHALDGEPRLPAPKADLFGGLALAVQGPEPVEIDVVHLVQGEFRTVIQLADVPVEEALQIELPLLVRPQNLWIKNRVSAPERPLG